MDWWTICITVTVVLVVTLPVWGTARRALLNKQQRVLASWEGLRITRTELIHGYKRDAPRHPLAGLTAKLDDSGGHAIVTVEGPGTHITESKRTPRRGLPRTSNAH
jgi:hypothetical protein